MTHQHSPDRKKLPKKPTICQCYLSVSAKLFSLFSTCAFHSIFFICARKTKSRTPVTMPTHCAVGNTAYYCQLLFFRRGKTPETNIGAVSIISICCAEEKLRCYCFLFVRLLFRFETNEPNY